LEAGKIAEINPAAWTNVGGEIVRMPNMYLIKMGSWHLKYESVRTGPISNTKDHHARGDHGT
jgi:hypothetical protein